MQGCVSQTVKCLEVKLFPACLNEAMVRVWVDVCEGMGVCLLSVRWLRWGWPQGCACYSWLPYPSLPIQPQWVSEFNDSLVYVQTKNKTERERARISICYLKIKFNGSQAIRSCGEAFSAVYSNIVKCLDLACFIWKWAKSGGEICLADKHHCLSSTDRVTLLFVSSV